MMRFDPVSDVARLDPFRKIEDILRNFSMIPAPRIVQGMLQIRMEASKLKQAYMRQADISRATKEYWCELIGGASVPMGCWTCNAVLLR